MGLDRNQRIISADDFLDIDVLALDLFQTCDPSAHREHGPRVVETEDAPDGGPHSREALADSPLASLGREVLSRVAGDDDAAVYGVG